MLFYYQRLGASCLTLIKAIQEIVNAGGGFIYSEADSQAITVKPLCSICVGRGEANFHHLFEMKMSRIAVYDGALTNEDMLKIANISPQG